MGYHLRCISAACSLVLESVQYGANLVFSKYILDSLLIPASIRVQEHPYCKLHHLAGFLFYAHTLQSLLNSGLKLLVDRDSRFYIRSWTSIIADILTSR